MVQLLLEHKNTIKPLLSTLRNVPHSSLVLADRFDEKKLEQEIKDRPILSSEFVVYWDSIPNQERVNLVSKIPENTYFFRCGNAVELEEATQFLASNGVEYQIIDNYNLPEEEVVKWVSETLTVNLDLAKRIYNRCGKYVPKVLEGVRMLERFDYVTWHLADKILPRRSSVSYEDLLRHMLKLETCEVRELYELFQQYKFGHRHMVGYMIKCVEDRLFIFDEMRKLNLTFDNVNEFFKENKQTLKIKISTKKFKRVMNEFEEVSMDYLYLLLTVLSDLYEDFSEYKFLNVIKMGGC